MATAVKKLAKVDIKLFLVLSIFNGFLKFVPNFFILSRIVVITNFQKQQSGGVLEKGALRIFAKLTGKHLCQSLFFNKVAGLRPATLLKKRLRHRCFPVSFVKFLRTPLLENASGLLLLSCFLVLCNFTRFLYFVQNFFICLGLQLQQIQETRITKVIRNGLLCAFYASTKR